MSAETPEPAKPPASAPAPAAKLPAPVDGGKAPAGKPEDPRDEGWWRWLRTQLRREPAHALTLGYLVVSLLGVWASYWFFRKFDIAILGYMSPADYLTAGLRDPVYLLIAAGAFGLSLLLNFHEYAHYRGEAYHSAIRARWWGRVLLPMPYRHESPPWMERVTGWRGLSMPTGMLFGMIWATMWLTMVYVDDKADDIKAGEGDVVRVTLSGANQPLPGTARMLGTVGDFVFLYWPQSKRAEAVSIEQVGRIQSLAADLPPQPGVVQSPAKAVQPPTKNPAPMPPAKPAAPGT